MTASARGDEPSLPGIRSWVSWVPASVPSLFQSSKPSSSVAYVK